MKSRIIAVLVCIGLIITFFVARSGPSAAPDYPTNSSLTPDVIIDIPAGSATMRVSNDPMMIDAVVSFPYAQSFEWTFDARRVVWVQVADSVGNWSEPYPGYAAPDAVAAAALVSQDQSNVVLTWQHAEANARYEVWRDTVPYFDPNNPGAETTKVGNVDPPFSSDVLSLTDYSIIQGTASRYFYIIRAFNAADAWADSSGVGVFSFAIQAGN